ncbi:TetR family transcriptional regulator [Halopolyspora algeriensis]|uniref:TetR family transcriptional regulator n=1 Tax=Halopolyspora algeriensis TaxID=1500506 RepID=A0A368VWS4_9ACTN|nr:TetR/AcrR family transcriptional regulator [Halopolyspora algeriensis]RCW45757.1 TetR family transcriptional regulator [Halopolyspora algeriensis]TQM54141.1 TetR family transcriptional regulator [Halopolyspora algeriensis]
MNDRSPAPELIAPSTRGNESAILNAALDAFGEQGFNGASMRDIARGARTSLSNLYNYFPSKSELLAELLRRANDEQLARTRHAANAEATTAAERLRAAVKAYVGFVVDHQVAALVAISEIRYLAGKNREHVVEARDQTQAIFEEIVADGVSAGEFTTPYPGDAARNITAMCSAISTWYRPEGRLSKTQLAEEQSRYALALLEARP